jgi:uncharacterized protein (DUF433 family)
MEAINHLESSAEVRGGQPRIVGTRITVSDIVIMHLRLGQAVEEIAGKYEVLLSAVLLISCDSRVIVLIIQASPFSIR